MKRLIWIADLYAAQYAGGAEIVNEIMIEGLESLGWNVEKWYCSEVTPERLRENADCKFVLGNFLQMNAESFHTMASECDYILYEHDHKYVRTRDPSMFPNYIAPGHLIVNTPIYRNAMAVLCQSKLHADVVKNNLLLSNVVDMSCSLWSEHELATLKQHCGAEKNNKVFILNSDNPIKGTAEAVEWCKINNIEYDLHGPLPHSELIATMAQYEKVVFFPRTLESFNRFVVEARALNCELITNKNNGATHQDWFPSLKGDELIQYLEAHCAVAPIQLSMLLDTGDCDWFTDPVDMPKTSLVTSMFKGEKHIRPFLEDITSQTTFKDCELIIINANSPENETPVIEEYMEKHDNIIYKKLDYDPGIYGVWNMGIEMATGDFISNANLDDRRSPLHVELHARELVHNPDVDLVYSESFVTGNDFETYGSNSSGGKVYPITDFSGEAMIKCLPGCMPVWRKTMHDDIGLFESDYKYAGDWEMWLRAVRNESVFKRLPGAHGMYFMNPDGLSTSAANEKERFKEEKEIFWEYTDVFGENVTNAYAEHFSGARK